LLANNCNKFSSFIEVIGNGKPVEKKRLKREYLIYEN